MIAAAAAPRMLLRLQVQFLSGRAAEDDDAFTLKTIKALFQMASIAF
jgi:hypothetical protein